MSTNAEVIATLAISGRATHDMVGPVTVGREPRAVDGTTIQIDDDPLVSKSHLAIDLDQDNLVITDLGSSNGTYLNRRGGEVAVPSDRWIPLPSDAEVEFGDQRIVVTRVAPRLQLTDAGVIDHDDDATPEKMLRPTAITCHGCHRLLTPGAKFCDGCGLSTAPAAPFDAVVGPPTGPSPVDDATVAHGIFESLAVDSATQEPRQSVKRSSVRTLVPFVVAAVIVGAVGFLALRLMDGDDLAERRELSVVPLDPVEVWTTSVSGQEPSALIGAEAVYVVAQIGDKAQLTSLGRAQGEQRWATDIENAEFSFLIEEFEAAMVAQVCSFEVEVACRVIGFDNDTGAELWSEGIGPGFAVASSAGVLVQNNGVVSLRDAATGDRMTRARGEILFSDPDVILIRDRNDVAVYDDDLREVFSSVEIDGNAEAVTFDGSRIVAVIDGQIEYVDENGQSSTGARLGAPVTRVVAVGENELVVEQDGEVVVYDMANGDALERWSEPGMLGVVLFVDGGPVVIVDDGDDQHVVDLATGDVRFDIEGSRERGVATRPGSNLLLVAPSAFESGPTELISALDWTTGVERWSEQVDGRFAVDGALVVAQGDGDVTFFE